MSSRPPASVGMRGIVQPGQVTRTPRAGSYTARLAARRALAPTETDAKRTLVWIRLALSLFADPTDATMAAHVRGPSLKDNTDWLSRSIFAAGAPDEQERAFRASAAATLDGPHTPFFIARLVGAVSKRVPEATQSTVMRRYGPNSRREYKVPAWDMVFEDEPGDRASTLLDPMRYLALLQNGAEAEAAALRRARSDIGAVLSTSTEHGGDPNAGAVARALDARLRAVKLDLLRLCSSVWSVTPGVLISEPDFYALEAKVLAHTAEVLDFVDDRL